MFSEQDLEAMLASVPLTDNDESNLWGRRQWTSRIKSAFIRIGKERGHYVCASGNESCDWGEWMFDVSWLAMDADKYVTDLLLAMEAELGNAGDVYDDFIKLLSSRARVRVIVFRAPSEKYFADLIKQLQTGIHRFSLSTGGDIVLWACYVEPQRRFVTGQLRT